MGAGNIIIAGLWLWHLETQRGLAQRGEFMVERNRKKP